LAIAYASVVKADSVEVNMRLVLILLLVFALPANPNQSIREGDRISLEVGTVTVWLGMTKEEAAKKFSNAGYTVTAFSDGLLLDRAGSAHDAHIIRFKNGRLCYADQEWLTGNNTDPLDAVLGALGALAEKVGDQPCSVIHSPLFSPNATSNRVFISCGQHSVFIAKGTFMGKPFAGVDVRIGDPPTKDQ
jgi:hypothetical protein